MPIPLVASWSLAARIAAPVAIVLAVLALVWGYGRRERLEGRAEIRAQWDAAKAKQRQVDAAARRANEITTQEIRDAYDANVARSSAAAADLRRELDRLRDTLAGRAGHNPGAAGGADGAPAGDRVVGECSAELAALAEHADAVEDRLSGLQEWVGRVCRKSTP
jgi:hypothetical protein